MTMTTSLGEIAGGIAGGIAGAPARPVAVPFPDWLPENAQLYLRHVEGGQSIRAIARAEGCHASTILRRVRRMENRRDDPLVDEALNRLARAGAAPPALAAAPAARASAAPSALPPTEPTTEETFTVTAPLRPHPSAPADRFDTADAASAGLAGEARRILRRLCEPGAQLAVAPEMDKAAVLRGTVRTAVTDRAAAQAFALKDWIAPRRQQGRVTLYEITQSGRAALKRLLAEAPERGTGLAEAPQAFDPHPAASSRPDQPPSGQPHADRHRVWGEREVTGEDGTRRSLRCNLAETPLTVLARRREKDGTLFLTPDLVAAGERLREDFELAQMGPRVAQNWDRFLTAGDRGPAGPGEGPAMGPQRARDRVAAALRELGPGLGDMVLRCCCLLEGLEAAERRLGWSARSGKIVLRIALIRLKRHYEETGGAPLIG
ncbi:DUF6456 domain-containing protein [Frigidibacter oleivorans]|uniref:DUF6456 domain-containing protein n=1 Tax=Frigidibacter oleivorans TaxID=2487129 RepID=UPI001F355F9D|nr:DUF6456 domain-containing protein [Frigidibacter oleivorans]